METQELQELNSVLKNTNLLLSDQMFFHLCTATAVWREGTTQFKKNPHSSSRFNWSLRFSIIFQIKELYYFLCIIEIVLNVSKHMIRKWDLLNEQEIALQFQQFQWAFFFLSKRKRKEEEAAYAALIYLLTCPLHSPHGFESIDSVCWWSLVFTITSPTEPELHSVLRETAGGKGRKGRWLNHLVMQVGDCVILTLWKGKKKNPFLQTSHHRNIPHPQPPSQPHRETNSYDFWL